VFGAAVSDTANNRAAIEGRFTSIGTGALTNARETSTAWHGLCDELYGSEYAVSNAATGRGTMSLAFTFGRNTRRMNSFFTL